MSSIYVKENIIKQLALDYSQNNQTDTLGRLYEALIDLAKPLYFKYVQSSNQKESAEDIIHDTCTICIENLQKGTVSSASGWTQYLISILKNRSQAFHPLHLSHAFWKRTRASSSIKTKLLPALATTSIVHSSLSKDIAEDRYDHDMKNMSNSVRNEEDFKKFESMSEVEEILRPMLKKFNKDCFNFLPFRDARVQNLFIYFSILSLFEIAMLDVACFKSREVSFFGSRQGWLPKRYIFLAGLIRTKFKYMLESVCVR